MQHGSTVLRFWNNDVLQDIDNVSLRVLRMIEGSQS
ncbi:DUF559 domain-containing protein [Rhizobium sp. BIGb0125]